MERRIFIKKIAKSAIVLESITLSFHSKVWAFILKNENSFFSNVEYSTIKSYFDIIIPKTAKGPSATEAKVEEYLLKILRNELPKWKRLKFTPSNFKNKTQTLYKILVLRLNQISQSKYSKNFIEIEIEQKNGIVSELSKSATKQVGAQVVGVESTIQFSDVELFSLTRNHVLQGYFADPKYGANRNFIAWESIKHICHLNYTMPNPECETHNH